MGLLRKEKTITGTLCTECGMEFGENQRLLRHYSKAHMKRKPDCKC